MFTFFHGWRRKMGVITLVMAMVGMAGWIRSKTEFDCFALTDNSWQHITLQSSCGTLSLFLNTLNSPQLTFWWSGEISKPDDLTDPIKDCVGCYVEWQRNWGGFTAASYYVKDGTEIIRTGLCIFPYWSVVLPLTLISAYLLLIPRTTKGKPQPNRQPIA